MLISKAEMERRKSAVEYAQNSVRLEGIILIDEIKTLNERYINGEIGIQDLINESKKIFDK